MSFLRGFIKLSVVIACAAGSFGGVQGYMAAKAEAAEVSVSKADPIAAKLAEDSELTGATRSMSPIYPTTKYTHAQLAVSPAMKPAKAKIAAVRPANKMPMQLAYAPAPQVATRAGAIFASVR